MAARFLNTNVLIRYLTRYDPDKAQQALKLLTRLERGEEKVGIDATIPFAMKSSFQRPEYADVDISALLPDFKERPWFEH